ncbi:hypothetical protein HDU91_003266 [Kappamyces sp. JEL0680]|nr:hypothetical protein HDU91_003266 [Kappamyces sp. JEL0680]
MSQRSQYKDETDLLYADPAGFISRYFSRTMGNKTLDGPSYPPGQRLNVPGQSYSIPQYLWPSHLVWYDNEKIAPVLKPLMEGSDYREVGTGY